MNQSCLLSSEKCSIFCRSFNCHPPNSGLRKKEEYHSNKLHC
uniref:Uncharacterized protein n=1 Tax=Anguilla anguilla TaxID=7936 RepID=A0A0E9XIC7_ANGAN